MTISVARNVANKATQKDTANADRSWLLGNALLLPLLLCFVFANIHSTHSCRALYAKLQTLESDKWYLQEDYGRLVLEQSTWASHQRVEKVARADLHMQAPELAHFKVVQQ